MAGAKGCNDDCAAFIIFLVNALLLIGTLISLAFIIYIWVMQGDLVKGGQEALNVYVPEVVLIAAIIIFLIILAVALLGIITTARQLKEHGDKEKRGKGHYTPEEEQRKKGGKGKEKGCCWNCGLSIYILLCLLGFLLLLAVGIVAGAYSDKMSDFSTLDNVRGQGEDWLNKLEDKLETEVLALADKYPETWNQTQAVAGCCGWSVIEATTVAAATDAAAAGTTTLAAATGDDAATDAASTGAAATDAASTGDDATDAASTGAAASDPATTADAATDAAATAASGAPTASDAPTVAGGRRVLSDASTVTAFTNSECCQNANVVTSVDIIGKIQFDFNGCRKDEADQVYTCQGVIASYIQSNLVKIAIISIVLAIAQLTLAVSGCVVRYPQCFPCCNCEKKKTDSDIEETEITEITTPGGV